MNKTGLIKIVAFVGSIASIVGVMLSFIFGSTHQTINVREQGTNIQIGNDNEDIRININKKEIPKNVIKTTGNAGEWLRDEYIEIFVPHKFRGPLLSASTYDLKFDLKNRMSTPLIVTKIIVKRYNKQAAIHFGNSSKATHEAVHNEVFYIEPNGQSNVSMVGNEILPKELQILVFHNLSSAPSMFEVNVDGGVFQSCLERLPKSVIFKGMDGLSAINRAASNIKSNGRNASLYSAFPGDKTTFIDSRSNLNYDIVKTWVVNFCATTGNLIVTIVDEGSVQVTNTKGKCVWSDIPTPKMGNQYSLFLANKNRSLCSNWKSLRLSGGIIEGKYISLWHLPYQDKNSYPVLVNALNGDKLKVVGVDKHHDLGIYNKTVSLE